MKRILLTGSNGQLGLALNRLLWQEQTVILKNTGSSELDIRDYQQVERILKEFQPDIIINCAAYTAVDQCETNQDLAYAVNAAGAGNLAVCAEALGAKLVQISTDYVFDGTKKTPYLETDLPSPGSVYGRTKLEGEQKVAESCKRHFIIRTAWLYGEGKNFVRTMLRLAEEKEEVTVVKDQFGTPTSALELARMILYLMDTENYGIYHGTCEGETSWYEFASEIFRQANLSVKVIPVTSQEYKTAAVRPQYSVLENNRLNMETEYRMKHWKDALQEYMEEEAKK